MGPMEIPRRAILLPAVLAACGRPKGTGYGGHAFVANRGGRSVAAVDLMRFAVARRIGLDAAPGQVLAGPAGKAYVLAPDAGVIYEIDAARLEISRTARLGMPASGMRTAPGGEALWALCSQAHCLVEVPLAGFRPGRRLHLPAPAADFDINRDGVAAFSFPAEGRIGFARLGASSVEATVAVGAAPGPVRFQSDGKQALAGNRGGKSLSIVSTEKARLVVTLPLPVEPAVFCFNSDGGQLFVSGPGMDAVAIVYPYSTEVAETVLAGRTPGAMGAAARLPYLFVANPTSGTVTVLDIDTRKLVAVVSVGQEPGHILFTPDAQYVLVLNRRSGDLAVIRLATLRTDDKGRPRRYKPAPLFDLIAVGPEPVSAAVI